MTTADKIIYFTAIFLFWRGWSKGLIQTILGPLALIIGTILSYCYYLMSRNLIVATAIGIIAPIILSIVFSMTLGVLFLGGNKKNLSILSRFCGALLNTFWGEALILAGMFLIVLIPLHIPMITAAQKDIKESSVYYYLTASLSKKFNIDVTNSFDPSKLSVLTDPKALETLGNTKEFKEVFDDPLIQDLLNDPEASHAIEVKNIGKLVQNPKFIALTKDPTLLKKFLALYSAILEKSNPKTPSTKKDVGTTQNSKGQSSSKSP